MEKVERIKVLSNEEVEKIHENTLKILEDTGIFVYSDAALRTFSELGLRVDPRSKIVKCSREIVENTLKDTPQEIELFNRDGKLAVQLGTGKTYTASGHNAIYVLEEGGRGRRTATKEDVSKFSLITDYLQDIDIVGIEAMPQDVTPESSLLHAVDAAFNNTIKHIFFSPERFEVLKPIYDIVSVVKGEGELGEKPPVTCQLSPTSPLMWEKGAIESLIETAKLNIPLCILPQPFSGVTSPYTLAGHLTVHNAETLSSIVFSQLINPRCPVIYGSAWSTFDMRTANVIIGSPETVLLRMAGSQLAEFYKIPYHTIAPDSDAHVMDEQLAWEKFATVSAAFLAHSDLIVNGGMFSTGLTVSFEQLVIDNEIFSYVKRMSRGIKVDAETLALDIIERVGPKGNYLSEQHTLDYLGSGEHWEPMISNREIYENWRRKGGKDVVKKARGKADSILKDHTVAELSDYKKKEIKKVIKIFERAIE